MARMDVEVIGGNGCDDEVRMDVGMHICLYVDYGEGIILLT